MKLLVNLPGMFTRIAFLLILAAPSSTALADVAQTKALLQKATTGDAQSRYTAIDDLGERLGDHNDCAVLTELLVTEAPGLCRAESGVDTLALLARQANALGEAAVSEAGRLFRQRPGAWRKTVRKRAGKARKT